MDEQSLKRHRLTVLAATVVIVSWGVAGLLQESDGFTDALYAPDYTIPGIRPGSVLEEAGFLAGDSVVTVEGIPVVELGMYSRWPRSLSRRPGESISMVVEREGELVTGEVVYRARASGPAMMRLGGVVIMLSFLGFGLWALFTVPTTHAVRLAYVGVAMGVGVPGPNIGSWDGVRTHVQLAGMVLWLLLLLRFFLLFPQPKRLGESRLATGLLYAPWVALIICLIVEVIYHPRFYHSFGGFNSILMLAYTVLAVAAVIHTASKTPSQELQESGMRLILFGVGIAFVGTAVALVDMAFIWSFDIPGSGYLVLLIAAVPLTMALGVRKQARIGVAA
ncbi:MAG: hypothetical protein KAJ42_03075 [Gemmatimonadetes bacterium]|nr:hypothetical protein [Gemmatimonadota bacterium]